MGRNERRAGTVAVAAGLLIVVASGTSVQSAEAAKAATKPISVFKVPSRVISMAVSPDNKLVALGRDMFAGGQHVITVRDVTTGKLVADLGPKKKLKGNELNWPVDAIAFSPDGKYLIASPESRSSPVRTLWDTSTWKVAKTLSTKGTYGASGFEFSPDGRLLAISQYIHEGPAHSAIHLWDVKTEQLKTTFDVDGNAHDRIVFSSDGKYLASLANKKIFVWEMTRLRKKTIVPSRNSGLGPFAFSPDGKTLSAIERNVVRKTCDLRIIDTSTWRDKKRINLGEDPTGIMFRPKFPHLVFAKPARGVKPGYFTEPPYVLFDYEVGRELSVVVPRIRVKVNPGDVIAPNVEIQHPCVLIGPAPQRASAISPNGDFLFLCRKGELSIWSIKAAVKAKK